MQGMKGPKPSRGRVPSHPLDLQREHEVYYAADVQPRRVDLGTIPFVTIDGQGPLSSPSFREAADGLAELVEGIQAIAADRAEAFERAPLETLWLDGPPPERSQSPPTWKLATRVPAFVHRDLVEEAAEETRSKPASLARYETIGEGPVVQALHRGPRGAIDEVYSQLEDHMEAHGLKPHGPAHEIHLDGPTPGRVARTVVRLAARADDRDAAGGETSHP